MSVPHADGTVLETFTNQRGVAVMRVVKALAACVLLGVAIVVFTNAKASSVPGVFVAISIALLATAALLVVHAIRLRPIVIHCYAERFTVEGLAPQLTMQTCRWRDISEVAIALTGGMQRSPKFPYIELTTPSGMFLGRPAKELVSDRLVQRINLMTPHLPYSWEQKANHWTHLLWEKVPRSSIPTDRNLASL